MELECCEKMRKVHFFVGNQFRKAFLYMILLFITLLISMSCGDTEKNESIFLNPTVVIAIFARNKAHTLPHFLGYLERLHYPKSRMSLLIRSDHNIDDTSKVINTWVDAHKDEYHSVDLLIDDSSRYFKDETGINDWSPMHMKHMIHLRENALKKARNMWAEYVWFIDSDVFIVKNTTLKSLIKENKTIIAPLLESLGAYSNYWCGMTEEGYYKRTDDYIPILEREMVGCFDVPMVHSAVLVDLRKVESLKLSFIPEKVDGYKGTVDDIIVFAHSAKSLGIKMYVLNNEEFGYMMTPMDKSNTLEDDKGQLTNLKVEMMVDGPEMYTSPILKQFVPAIEADKIGLDEAYLINLERRPERRMRMLLSFKQLGIKVNVIPAVDGNLLDASMIAEMGIQMLPEYADPYHKRPLTTGEIGCFLSHYAIWKDIIAKQHRTAIVFEDDLRFEPFFRKKIDSLLKEAQRIGLLWDLIYLGRKRLSENTEPYVQGSTNFVHVDYSYWTLCYLITLEGAKKLVSANPLSKMVPVDEYLPIMFDRHPEHVWKEYYPIRNLRAFSSHPLLVYPTHYTGEPYYISDTENSNIVFSTLEKAKDEL